MRIPLATMLTLLSATVAAAGDEPTFDLSGEIGVVSDYRWRGVSLTDNDPAVQAGLYLTHKSGVYLSVWSSAPTRGARDVEIDFALGYAFGLGGGDMDVSVEQYYYPGLDGVDYVNFATSYERALKGWTVRALIDYAPVQDNLGDDSFYGALEVERPIRDTGLTLTAGAGWEEGVFTLDGAKWDYSIGATYQIGPVSFGATFTDTDERAPAGDVDIYNRNVTLSILAEF